MPIVQLLIANWKAVAIALILMIVSVKSYQIGAKNVQNKWDLSVAENNEKVRMEKDRLQEESNKKSAEYQAEIARQKSNLNRAYKVLNYEISKNYSGCIANNELVRVWRQAFGESNTITP